MCVNWKIQVQVLTAVRERMGLSVILYVKQPFVNLILDDAERMGLSVILYVKQ